MGILAALSVAVVATALLFSLIADYRVKPAQAGLLKMTASCGFLFAAWHAGATRTTYGLVLLAGLMLSWWGDLFLISEKRSIFLAGLVSFLAAHVAYVIAFLAHGVAWRWSAGAALVLLPAVIVIQRWLRPHLTADMRYPVYAYMAVISVMLALAVGASGAAGPWLIPTGALAFYVSDLFVARQRFVTPGHANRLWGLPLYYLGQVLLALSPAWT
jgi:uncharacterized membrane protein YhhN